MAHAPITKDVLKDLGRLLTLLYETDSFVDLPWSPTGLRKRGGAGSYRSQIAISLMAADRVGPADASDSKHTSGKRSKNPHHMSNGSLWDIPPLRSSSAAVKDYIPLLQTAMWVCLAVIAIAAFRPPLIKRIEAGSRIKVGMFELDEAKQTVQDIQLELAALGERVSRLFLLTMAPPMYTNLKKLASRRFGPLEMTDGLKRKLYHLRDIGYVYVESIGSIPVQGEDLSSHVTVSPAGEQFVQYRDEADSTG